MMSALCRDDVVITSMMLRVLGGVGVEEENWRDPEADPIVARAAELATEPNLLTVLSRLTSGSGLGVALADTVRSNIKQRTLPFSRRSAVSITKNSCSGESGILLSVIVSTSNRDRVWLLSGFASNEAQLL